MSVEENIQVIHTVLDMVNERRLADALPYLTPGFKRHDLTGAYPGVTQGTVVDFIGELIKGAPDLKLAIEDIFGAGDRVTVRLSATGTHEGVLFGQPPTGREFSFNGINIYRFVGGKIAETWQLADVSALA